MAQSQIAFKESFHYWNTHTIAGGVYYMALLTGGVFPVGNASITSSSTLAGLTEATGTGYARQSFTLGTDTNGVMVIPQVSFTNGSNAWSSNVNAVAMSNSISGGVAIYCWDTSAVRDMSVLNSTFTITSPPLNIFTENPGGV